MTDSNNRSKNTKTVINSLIYNKLRKSYIYFLNRLNLFFLILINKLVLEEHDVQEAYGPEFNINQIFENSIKRYIYPF